MVANPILSVCIPTFNRATKLDNILGIIANEIRGWHDKIEICISDNGSSDKTQKVIAKWKKLIPITSGKNKINMGYDVNMVKAIQLAKGDFAMCMGDDDDIVAGSLKQLVNDLSRHEKYVINAIYLNSLKNGLPVTKFGFDSFRIASKGGMYPPLSLSFGGAICLRTEIAKRIIKQKTHFKNDRLCKREKDIHFLDEFVHTYLFLECAKYDTPGLIGLEPGCVVSVQGKGASISIAKRFYFDLIFNLYYLNIKTRYPWANESIYLDEGGVARHIFRRYVALSYMLCSHPELQDAFMSIQAASLKILKLEGLTTHYFALRALIAIQIFLSIPIEMCIDAYKFIFGKKDFLSESIDNVGTPPKTVDDFFTYARKYQIEEGLL